MSRIMESDNGGCSVTGLCLAMCPEAERIERERNRRLSIFEIVPGTENDKKPITNSLICVKEYSRSAAGRKIDGSRLRPPKILLATINYLINEVVDQDKHRRSWLDVYNFVSDRIRAVVQDMIIHRADASTSITILQKAVRFHILLMQELQNERNFDRKLCFEQLSSYLSSLLGYNEIVAQCEPKHHQILDEFSIYYLLLHLNSDKPLQYVLSLKNCLWSLSKPHPVIKLVLSNAVNNFVAVFRAFEKLPYISSCCIVQHINSVRLTAFKIMANAYSCKKLQFPVSALQDWLKFDDEKNTSDFCEKLGFIPDKGFITFNKNFNPTIDLDISTELSLARNKKQMSIKYYVNNGEYYN